MYTSIAICIQLFRAPQLYIFGKFASVTSRTSREIRNDIRDLYHSFHQEDLTKMMTSSDQSINFKGHEIVFRIAEMQHSCYMVDDYRKIQDRSHWTWIHNSKHTPLTGIKLLHLSTKRPCQSSRYGDVVCTIPYNEVITNYLQTRKHFSKEKDKVAYRVACTQIHTQEINHMIIICCDGDEELKDFPILGPDNITQHFTPEVENTPKGINYSAKILQYSYRDKRHEELTISLYLPQECQLSLSQRPEKVEHDSNWCHNKSKAPFFTGLCPSRR